MYVTLKKIAKMIDAPISHIRKKKDEGYLPEYTIGRGKDNYKAWHTEVLRIDAVRLYLQNLCDARKITGEKMDICFLSCLNGGMPQQLRNVADRDASLEKFGSKVMSEGMRPEFFNPRAFSLLNTEVVEASAGNAP
jgi:hypothetical protein